MPIDKLTHAYTLIDQANAEDPNKEKVNNELVAKELIYGKRMTDTLEKFEPHATEALKLAARSQHICRWKISRDNYPLDRVGYLKWREELKKFHAKKSSEILESVGYSSETINRVSFLIQKKQLKKDEDTQTLEDVICLVFLNFYYPEFLIKHTEEKIIDILQKTWRKMSDKGHEAALQLSFSEKALELIKKALF
ncbi:DUF4202 domain-containing protein [Aquimarina muelleri]|uniref:DUF4202 domain-containing protein n=1 Tax=Aquimarina muelleri TaxID=279356 RepID=A0A918JYC6_9FLAO|nr:DUF4202 domain-containing protein [Aquimarina muelleri]MCX2763271.1 DUF4202 domain-containing protein [Aquimarina muelleri]GGX27519.1 hypothetical protein GCM10007384_31010 [Aquimarina muelleri]